jgi:Pilus formation protein N terminal region
MRRAAGTLLLSAFIAATAAATVARAESTVIHLNQSRRIALRGAAANVIIGDANVADVTVIDSHSILLMGKAYGATDVLVLDHAGRTLLDDHVMVAAQEGGVVTVHRGSATVEYSCTPRCQALSPPKEGSGAAAASSSPSGPPTNPPAAPPAPSPST